MGRRIINLSVKIKGTIYNCSTVALLDKTKELFYHFNVFERNISMETGGKNERDETGIFDHISMHKDGTVHLTTRKLSGKTERLKMAELNQNVFNLDTYGMFPLLIDSFKVIIKSQDKTLPNAPNVLTHCWKLEKWTPFSITLFLMRSVDAYNGRKVKIGDRQILCPPDAKQIDIWLNNLKYKDWIQIKDCLIAEVFNGWYLFGAISYETIVDRKFEGMSGSVVNRLNSRVFAVLPPQDLEITFLDKEDERKDRRYHLMKRHNKNKRQ